MIKEAEESQMRARVMWKKKREGERKCWNGEHWTMRLLMMYLNVWGPRREEKRKVERRRMMEEERKERRQGEMKRQRPKERAEREGCALLVVFPGEHLSSCAGICDRSVMSDVCVVQLLWEWRAQSWQDVEEWDLGGNAAVGL